MNDDKCDDVINRDAEVYTYVTDPSFLMPTNSYSVEVTGASWGSITCGDGICSTTAAVWPSDDVMSLFARVAELEAKLAAYAANATPKVEEPWNAITAYERAMKIID